MFLVQPAADPGDAGGLVDNQLPARPNLDHLRGQAKSLLADAKAGKPDAVRVFEQHLPARTPAAKLRLADAQSVVARRAGFASWAVLVRHVEQLRALEGEWHIARLEIDGNAMPEMAMAGSRILIDGDRFRTESPGATYEGVFSIDAEASPPHFTIDFVSGPEAGNRSEGIYRITGPDEFALCLSLGETPRPTTFATSAGSGHALETLRRVSVARPANVTGGTPPPPEPVPPSGDERAFGLVKSALLDRLQGDWSAVELVAGGKATPAAQLSYGSRSMTGNEVKVVFGGRTMIHAKVRFDETASPIAVDYFNLLAKHRGAVTLGIMEWLPDDTVRFLMAPAGAPRPTSFDQPGTLSRWRKK
jgi:uncharacterized protein (TIGR03067 family)